MGDLSPRSAGPDSLPGQQLAPPAGTEVPPQDSPPKLLHLELINLQTNVKKILIQMSIFSKLSHILINVVSM